jgi:tetratricopeptide (TPR) repeat protein
MLIIVAELLGGGFLAARRLLRVAPPAADWSLVDPATADDLKHAAARCESAADWRNLGELFMAPGLFPESEMCHRVACELEPQNALYHRQWAFALERLGLLEDANAQYRRTMELSRIESNDCRYFIARNRLREEQPAEARELFEAGRTLPANLYEVARLQFRAGELDQAEASRSELKKESPDTLQVNLLGYRIAMERGKPREAFEFADGARYALRKLQNPFDKEVERIIAVTQHLGPARIWKRGRELIDSGRLEQAQAVLEEAGEADRSTEVLELLAEIALRQRRFDDAIALLEELQQRHGPFARITARIGDVWAARQSSNARDYWQQAAQFQSGVDLKAMHHKLADSLAAAGDAEAASRERALGHFFVGRELLQFGYADKSVRYFQGAADLDPAFDQAWFYLGEARRRIGQAEEAKEAYRKSLELNPNHGRALAALAWLEKA